MAENNDFKNNSWNYNYGQKLEKQERTIDIIIAEEAEQKQNNLLAKQGEKEATYSETLQKANNLATKLVFEYQISDNDFALFLFEKDIDIFAAYLGVLKAGAAFVPVIPDHPIERLKYVLVDSKAKVIITQKRFSDLVTKLETKVPVIFIEDIKADNNSFESRAKLDSLAYMIYTSGSTGHPKGVLINNKTLVESIIAHNMTIDCQKNENHLTINALCFDASILSIFTALVSGSTIHLLEANELSPELVAKKIRDYKIDFFITFPSFLNQLFSYWENNKSLTSEIKDLKIECGGEAMPLSLAEKFFSLNLNMTTLFNCYGPTETGIVSHLHKVNQRDLKREKTIPIGHPLPGRKCKILKEDNSEAIIGECGELLLGGAGMGNGYNNLPQETEKGFIKIDNEIFYRTGDLVKINDDETLTFIHRIDNQVNIRGNRVEFSEIDNVFLKHPVVGEAVTVLINSNTDKEMLVLYYTTSNSDTLLTRDECTNLLKKSLPDYMIPNIFIKIDKFPINHNDKIDRKLLISKAEEKLLKTDFEEPSDEIEELLKYLWANSLGFNNFGVEDIFFELGGHSLLATKLLTLINKAFKVKIPVYEFFENPTISDFKEVIFDYLEDEDKALKIAQIRLEQLKEKS